MGDPDPTDLINAEVLSESMEGHILILAQNHQRVERLVFKSQQVDAGVLGRTEDRPMH
jgi:hypothetical protein